MEVATPPAPPALQRAGPPLPAVGVAGLAGSVLVTLAGWSTGVFPRLGRPSSWPVSPVVLPGWAGWLAWFGGLALLSVAWVGLHRLARGGGGLTIARVALVTALWCLPLLTAPPLGSRDAYSYAAHGELASLGVDPGSEPPSALPYLSPFRLAVDPLWRDVVSAYGPASTGVAEATVAATGHDVAATVLGLRLWMVAGVALMGVGVVVVARRAGYPDIEALVLAVAGPLTVVQLVGGAHNEALMAGFMMLGLAAAATWPGPAGAALGAALVGVGAAVKVPALAAVVYLGWRYDGRPASSWERAGRVLGLLVIALAAMEVLHLACGLSWGWVGGLTAASSVTTLLSISTTLGLLVRWLFVPLGVDRDTTLDAVRTLVQLAGFAIAAVLLWRTPKLGLAGLGGALLVIALLGASVHPWYAAWALPVLAVVAAGRWANAFLAGGIVLSASTRPQGGGLLRNLGFYPWYLLPALVLAGAVGWWWVRRRGAPRGLGREAPS